jgi:hypothetical protein
LLLNPEIPRNAARLLNALNAWRPERVQNSGKKARTLSFDNVARRIVNVNHSTGTEH